MKSFMLSFAHAQTYCKFDMHFRYKLYGSYYLQNLSLISSLVKKLVFCFCACAKVAQITHKDFYQTKKIMKPYKFH